MRAEFPEVSKLLIDRGGKVHQEGNVRAAPLHVAPVARARPMSMHRLPANTSTRCAQALLCLHRCGDKQCSKALGKESGVHKHSCVTKYNRSRVITAQSFYHHLHGTI